MTFCFFGSVVGLLFGIEVAVMGAFDSGSCLYGPWAHCVLSGTFVTRTHNWFDKEASMVFSEVRMKMAVKDFNSKGLILSSRTSNGHPFYPFCRIGSS